MQPLDGSKRRSGMGTVLAFRRRSDAASPTGDDELVARCRAGERDALGELLGRHAAYLERMITRVHGPGPDVEDILQQTFEAAITAFPRYRGEAKLETWLARIAVHVAIDALRRPARRRSVPVADLDTREGAAPTGDDIVATRHELARLNELLDELTPVRRIAFVLHVLDGHPIDEVAALMGASVMATKSRIFWARRTLLARAKRDPLLRARFGGGS